MPQNPISPPSLFAPILFLYDCFLSGPQLQVFLPPYGPNPIIAGAERVVFALSLGSSFAQKLHALVAVGQSTATEGDLFFLGCDVRWCVAEEVAAVLHGNSLLVCMHESRGAGRPSKRGWMWRRPGLNAPWLIVLPRESPGRPVLSHWGAEALV